ncbi:MAG: serine/threonine transporter SstT [Campylobacteraceae bacterium]
MQRVVERYKNGNIVLQIIVGMIAGVVLALISKDLALSAGILGGLFTGALKAIAPILIFILVIVAIATKPKNVQSNIKPILFMYIIGMLLAALFAVMIFYAFPTKLVLSGIDAATGSSATDIREVLRSVLFKMVDNPVNALASGNFIGVLTWGVGIGIALYFSSSSTTKEFLVDANSAALSLVRFIIRLAPFGIFGITAQVFAETGVDALLSYVKILGLLVSSMLFTYFVINPVIMFMASRRNPYPVVFKTLAHSAIFAFFTRSSAANTPVNLELCKKMGLDPNTYTVSIPLGTAINMSGAAITITIFTLATAYTVGVDIGFGSALLLCVISALAACGVSGVAGGSLMLIPLACGLFNISNDIAMQVVAIGFMIGVIQDSVETALNSATDVMFTAAVSKIKPNLDF